MICGYKVLREVASGAKTDGAQLRRLLGRLEAGDVATVARLDRPARSTRDLSNTFATIVAKQTGFRSPGDTWVDNTTSHGRPKLIVPGSDAEPERDLPRARTTEGTRAGEGARREDGRQARAHRRTSGGRRRSGDNVRRVTISRLGA
jgi:DNA invertase Pin-like site-specific DNA recombinase